MHATPHTHTHTLSILCLHFSLQFATLPGIDPNDATKTNAAFKFYFALFSCLPLSDVSTSSVSAENEYTHKQRTLFSPLPSAPTSAQRTPLLSLAILRCNYWSGSSRSCRRRTSPRRSLATPPASPPPSCRCVWTSRVRVCVCCNVPMYA